MLLFKSDKNWDYVTKIQLHDFYLHIHNYRVSENNTESEKKLHKILSKTRGRKKEHILFMSLLSARYSD